jgi:ligand-binding sensor domain-containing protein
MKKCFRQTQIFTFLTILSFVISCNGQVKKDPPTEKTPESRVISARQQKHLKTKSPNKGDNVHCSLQDKAGNLWFGTTGDGVYKYDGKWFTQFTAADALNSNTVWCILEDKTGKIWIGTDDGVCVYDGKKFSKIQLPLSDYTPNNKYDVWSIMQCKSGKLWFATTAGVYCFDNNSFIAFQVNNDASGFQSKMVEYILEDKDGNFWFGGRVNNGVFRYDGKSLINLKPNGDNWAWPVLQDKKGNIWFSNWRGAYRYDGKSFTSFTKNNGLAGDAVTRIIEDKTGKLWFGSLCEDEKLGFGSGGGICLYDGKSFTGFTIKDGLLNNDIWSILEDKTGNLWIGTRGTILHRFDGRTFTNFSE